MRRISFRPSLYREAYIALLRLLAGFVDMRERKSKESDEKEGHEKRKGKKW